MRRTCLTFLLACAFVACNETALPPANCDLQGALAAAPDWSGACAAAEADWADARCVDAAWQVPLCTAATVIDGADFGAQHIALPLAITYADNPPMSGPHRGDWPFWGEYAFLPKQFWLHGLEHGAIAILYNPCAPQDLVDTLRKWAQNEPPDDAGAFRWLLTPYPGLDSAFSLVAWKHRLKANCWDAAAAEQFRDAHYRKASEDVPFDGTFACTWAGKSCGVAGGASAASATDGMSMGGIHRDAQ